MNYQTIKASQQVLKKLMEEEDSETYFNVPVDADALGIPMYKDVVKTPMDLGTVQQKLDSNQYQNLIDFLEDVVLVWHNCCLFNEPTSDVYEAAQYLEKQFKEFWKQNEQLQKQLDIDTFESKHQQNKEPVYDDDSAMYANGDSTKKSKAKKPKKENSIEEEQNAINQFEIWKESADNLNEILGSIIGQEEESFFELSRLKENRVSLLKIRDKLLNGYGDEGPEQYSNYDVALGDIMNGFKVLETYYKDNKENFDTISSLKEQFDAYITEAQKQRKPKKSRKRKSEPANSQTANGDNQFRSNQKVTVTGAEKDHKDKKSLYDEMNFPQDGLQKRRKQRQSQKNSQASNLTNFQQMGGQQPSQVLNMLNQQQNPQQPQPQPQQQQQQLQQQQFMQQQQLQQQQRQRQQKTPSQPSQQQKSQSQMPTQEGIVSPHMQGRGTSAMENPLAQVPGQQQPPQTQQQNKQQSQQNYLSQMEYLKYLYRNPQQQQQGQMPSGMDPAQLRNAQMLLQSQRMGQQQPQSMTQEQLNYMKMKQLEMMRQQQMQQQQQQQQGGGMGSAGMPFMDPRQLQLQQMQQTMKQQQSGQMKPDGEDMGARNMMNNVFSGGQGMEKQSQGMHAGGQGQDPLDMARMLMQKQIASQPQQPYQAPGPSFWSQGQGQNEQGFNQSSAGMMGQSGAPQNFNKVQQMQGMGGNPNPNMYMNQLSRGFPGQGQAQDPQQLQMLQQLMMKQRQQQQQYQQQQQ